MKRTAIYLSIAILITVIGGSVYLDSNNPTMNEQQVSSLANGGALTWGSSGEQVKTVQQKLLSWGFFSGKVDGVYGADTYRGVRRFQRKHGIKEDGIVGGETAKKIGVTLKGTTTASGKKGVNRDDEVYLLARAIHGEARGEPYIGKVAVGAVILNRVKDSEFPNTIAGVIYQPLAFTAVADGQINLEPNEDAMKAARDSLNGWDPTYGCTYYWNPVTSTSKWIWSRKVMLKLGKHWFGV